MSPSPKEHFLSLLDSDKIEIVEPVDCDEAFWDMGVLERMNFFWIISTLFVPF